MGNHLETSKSVSDRPPHGPEIAQGKERAGPGPEVVSRWALLPGVLHTPSYVSAPLPSWPPQGQ